MKCKTIHKKLIFFLEGDLPASQMEEVQKHLSQCNSCNAFAKDLKNTLGIIELEKKPSINPFFFTRLKAKLENRMTEPSPAYGRIRLINILQPALFSLFLIIGIYSGIKIGQPASTKHYTEMLMQNGEIPYLNEMETETIELSLME